MELLELFGIIALTLRSAIKTIYKSGVLDLVTTQRCDLAMPASWATFYNLEVVVAPAYRLKKFFVPFLFRQAFFQALRHCLQYIFPSVFPFPVPYIFSTY